MKVIQQAVKWNHKYALRKLSRGTSKASPSSLLLLKLTLTINHVLFHIRTRIPDKLFQLQPRREFLCNVLSWLPLLPFWTHNLREVLLHPSSSVSKAGQFEDLKWCFWNNQRNLNMYWYQRIVNFVRCDRHNGYVRKYPYFLELYRGWNNIIEKKKEGKEGGRRERDELSMAKSW